MNSAKHDQRLLDARRALDAAGQGHLLSFFDELDESGRDRLLTEIENQDWAALTDLIERYVRNEPEAALPDDLAPAPYFPAQPSGDLADRYRQARELGGRKIREGKVAAFTVAGGQGTRLGWDGPKGTFPATPITGKPLFRVFAESLRKTGRKYGVTLPWYIMTSPINDAPTRAFFDEHDYFGLSPDQVSFFQQGTVPSFSKDGLALLDAKDRLATNPDGHGGSLRALHRSGALAQMRKAGVEHISYFQIDNPLVKCVDPLFIGLHALEGAQMSSKMVTKTSAGEKVGVFCVGGGRVRVIEYSDLPHELAEQTDDDGNLRYIGGSIAIHVIDTDFVARLNEGAFGLPWHRAVKKVPYVDPESGERVTPTEPNAVKLETFVFDALPLCDKSIVLETPREEEFGPIKNAEGVDSPATSVSLQSRRACRWLEAAGVEIAHKADGTFDAVVELSPLTAIEPGDLLDGVKLPPRIGSGEQVTL